MIAEYNKWYPCKEGTMPECFENVDFPITSNGEEDIRYTYPLVVWLKTFEYVDTDERVMDEKGFHWRRHGNNVNLAWMLPEPYRE